MRSGWTHGARGLAFALLLALVGWNGTPAAGSEDVPGAVYTMTNAAGANAVVMFDRGSDGTLRLRGTFPTGGNGSGAGLGNQGGLVLSRNRRWLYVVNAGTDDLSVFAVLPTGLRLVDRVPSGGLQPISITEHRGLVYVLNAGGDGNITGFEQEPGDLLHPLAGSTRPLSGSGVGPAQIAFNRRGTLLAVTEKVTNRIDLYVVGKDGLPSDPNVQPSSGMTPFGFAFDRRGRLIVSEAFGGVVDASAASSYNVGASGDLAVISASVPTTETAACWIAITPDNRFAYTTNTGSGSISGYRIGGDGSLTLLDPDGRTGETGEGSTPIDLAFSVSGRFLYALTAGNGQIAAFQVRADGSLEALSPIGGLPASVNGLAAR